VIDFAVPQMKNEKEKMEELKDVLMKDSKEKMKE